MKKESLKRSEHLAGGVMIAGALTALAAGVLTGSKSLALAIILVVGLCVCAAGARLKSNKLAMLKNRASLSQGEVFDQFYASYRGSRGSVNELWYEVATALEVPPEKMRPNDKLAELAKSHLFLDDELDELAGRAMKRAAALNREVKLLAVTTVDHYVKLFL